MRIQNIEVEIEKYTYPNDALEAELKILADKYAEVKTVEGRKSLNTDIVNMDFDGEVDGEKIKGGAAKGYTLDLAHCNFIRDSRSSLLTEKSDLNLLSMLNFPKAIMTIKSKEKMQNFN